ncbi:MAG: hypothetical protein P8Y06_00310 [Patescibacteria group bacterium]
MPRTPEKEPRGPVVERAEEFEVPPQLKDTGIEGIETAVKARVKKGKQDLIQTPATQKVSIKLPGDQNSVIAWSKGKITNSLTWLGAFSLRMIKKATHFGRKIVWGGRKQDASVSS